MTIKVNSDSCDAEFVINDEARVDEYLDVIYSALILEGFTHSTVISGFKEIISELKRK